MLHRGPDIVRCIESEPGVLHSVARHMCDHGVPLKMAWCLGLGNHPAGARRGNRSNVWRHIVYSNDAHTKYTWSPPMMELGGPGELPADVVVEADVEKSIERALMLQHIDHEMTVRNYDKAFSMGIDGHTLRILEKVLLPTSQEDRALRFLPPEELGLQASGLPGVVPHVSPSGVVDATFKKLVFMKYIRKVFLICISLSCFVSKHLLDSRKRNKLALTFDSSFISR